MAAFVHEPMRDPTCQIRLLSIQPAAAEDDSIHCTMTTYELAKAPHFAAISYTWGPLRPVLQVIIDGKSFSVRLNAWEALRQVQLYGCYGFVWIDSICINQEDITEKGHQVDFMGDIFRAASIVLPSLGLAMGDFEYSILHKIAEYAAGLVALPNDSFGFGFVDRVKDSTKWLDEACTGIRPWLVDATHGEFFSYIQELEQNEWTLLTCELRAVMLHPYWSRVWVVPELTFAKTSTLLIEAGAMSFKGLALLYLVIWSLTKAGYRGLSYRQRVGSRERRLEALFASSIVRATQPAFRECQSFIHVLEEFSERDFTDFRDRLFVSWRLLEWPLDMPQLAANYKLDSHQLAVLVLPYVVHAGGTMADLEPPMKKLAELLALQSNSLEPLLCVTSQASNENSLEAILGSEPAFEQPKCRKNDCRCILAYVMVDWRSSTRIGRDGDLIIVSMKDISPRSGYETLVNITRESSKYVRRLSSHYLALSSLSG
jgi:hypothetical protein